LHSSNRLLPLCEVAQYGQGVDSSVNQFAEALIRAGVGGPLCVGLGLVLIETKGRKTGAPRSVPVLANRVGNRLYVSTVRSQSQWIRNVEADDTPRVIVDRKSRAVRVKSVQVGPVRVLELLLQKD
jgi:deazaflavin-dependent oxidoreductase (nitroreductase family)